jgi:dihydrofolate reductase
MDVVGLQWKKSICANHQRLFDLHFGDMRAAKQCRPFYWTARVVRFSTLKEISENGVNGMKTVLLMAMTLDGKIAKDSEHFPDWTGKEDKRLFAKISKRAGAVIMGSKTFDTLGKPLPGRKNIILTRDRTRKSPWENLVFTDEHPRDILDGLQREGYREVILAGGTLINSIFAEENLIDEVMVTVSPIIFGTGISLFVEDISMKLQLITSEKLGRDLVFLHYRVIDSQVGS